MNRIWKFCLIIVGLILLDQFTKGVVQQDFRLGESRPVIDGFFNFTYVQNTGAAFGMGRGYPRLIKDVLFLYLPVLLCFWLCWLIIKTRNDKSAIEGSAYMLILAGAIGNLIDRFSMGYVVDFLDFYIGRSHFPAFNVADSAITIGGVLLGINFILESIRIKKEAEAASGDLPKTDDQSGA
jgi:signal peptidase II